MKALMPLLLLPPLILSGCMTYEEARMGDVGQTVYLTTYQQIADKERAANPGTDISPTGIDGPLVEKVMDDFRGVTGDASRVSQPIEIKVDTSNGGR